MCWRTRAITLLLAAVIAIQGGARMFAGDTNFDYREQFILSEINRIRAQQGLPRLRLNHKLCAMARATVPTWQEPALSPIPTLWGETSKRDLEACSLSATGAAENVATNNFPDSARVAVQGWCQSPGHLRNILNERFTETGIGVAVSAEGQVFFTQIFLGK